MYLPVRREEIRIPKFIFVGEVEIDRMSIILFVSDPLHLQIETIQVCTMSYLQSIKYVRHAHARFNIHFLRKVK